MDNRTPLNYRGAYRTLFKRVTMATRQIEKCNYGAARCILALAMQEDEDVALEEAAGDTPVMSLEQEKSFLDCIAIIQMV